MPQLIQLARTQAARLLASILLGFAGGLLTVLQAFWLSRAVSRVFLDGQGLDAIEFFTQKKVVIERWPKEWSRQF